MRNAVGVAALLAVVTTAAGAQDSVRLAVQASGSEGRPVAGATIVIDRVAVPNGRTDSQGRWTGFVPAGVRHLRLLSIGLRPRDTVLVVGARDVVVEMDLRETMVPLGEVIVTAARREQRLADAVVETELITARDLARGPSDLASVLSERTGVQLDGGVPAGAGIQLRGFGSRRVLLLLDGQPLVGRVNGTMDLGRLPVSGIERIEIVKGPQSTLYGTDAIGGVINVITRKATADGPTAGLTTTAGAAGRTEVSGDAAWRRGSLSTAVDGGFNTVNLVPGLGSDVSTYSRRGHAGLRGTFALDSTTRLEWGALGLLERQRYRTGQLFHFGDNVQTAFRFGAHRARGGDQLQATVSASTFDHLSRAATREEPASDSGSNDRQRLAQAEVGWSSLRGSRVWDAGVAMKREWIDADRLSQEQPTILGVEPYAQVTLTVGKVLLTPGARVSWSDRWGRFAAPRVAALLRPRDDLAIRASLGRGYRAPDFKELYLSFVNDAAGYAVYGNPDLRPERSTSASLGAEWTGARAFFRATTFNSGYRDFIETRAPNAMGEYTYGNIDHGWTRGIEFEGGLLVSQWRVEGGAERLWTRDDATGSPLLGRAPYTLRGSVSGPVAGLLRAGARFAYVARTPDSRNEVDGSTGYRPALPQLDLRFSRGLGDRFELGAEVSNVLDRRLGADWPGFTGRRASVQLKWRSDGLIEGR
jgi:outer membrane receptor for ferrienterochelin and colicins